MKKLLVGLAAMPFLACVAMAGQPMPLSEAQMDRVTAGNYEYTNPIAPPYEILVWTPTNCYAPCIQVGDDPHSVAFISWPGRIVQGPAANFEPPNTVDILLLPGLP